MFAKIWTLYSVTGDTVGAANIEENENGPSCNFLNKTKYKKSEKCQILTIFKGIYSKGKRYRLLECSLKYGHYSVAGNTVGAVNIQEPMI